MKSKILLYTFTIFITLITATSIYFLKPDCRIIDTSKMITKLNLTERKDIRGIPPFTFKVFKEEKNTWYQCLPNYERLYKEYR